MARSVLVVDDHAGFRGVARRLLECDGYEVVGEAADGAEALVAARAHAPDLALVDVYLPDIDGFEVASQLAALPGGPEVILTSSHEQAEFEHLLNGNAARGFVPKDELSREALEGLLR
jgi:DNA-binding NarL/FixJ family response regulator